MTHNQRRKSLLAVSTVMAALALAACGSGDNGSESTAQEGSTTAASGGGDVTVGVIPIIDIAPLQMAIDEGAFEDAGINVTTQNAQGGAAIVPAVVSGEFQFGYGNLVSLMSAQENGLGLKIIAIGARASQDPLDDGAGQLLVQDPAITDIKGLEGKTIGVNTLKGINEIAVKNGLENAGLSVDAVNLVEMPIPTMRANLAEGKVDGVMISEPFTSMAKDDGAHPLPISYAAMGESMPIAAWFTSEEFANDNPALVESFANILRDSLAEADSDEAAPRAALGNYLELEPGLADQVTLPGWDPEVDVEQIRPLAELAVKFEVIKDANTIDALVQD